MTESPFSDDAIHDVSTETFVAGDDHSPYAQTLETGEPRRLEMVRWVIRAREQRIRHLGLMLPSRASRRFSRINILWMAVAIGVTVFVNAGWRVSVLGPGIGPESAEPTGRGWFRVLEFETDAARLMRDVQPAMLWWNQPWATVAGVAVFFGSWVVLAAALALIGYGAEHAGGGGRFRCAVHYGTSWLLLMIPAVVLLAFRPLSFVAMKFGVAARAITVFIDLFAILTCVSIAMLWMLWQMGLSAAAPAPRRGRVRRFFAITAPLMLAVIAGASAFGAYRGLPDLQRALNMQW